MKYFPNTLKNPTVGQFWDHFTHFQKKKEFPKEIKLEFLEFLERIPRKAC